ncbi:MAG: PilN domain-containing protein [Deltaproteobacteria bacterium]|nr:PilN domain-containing protein [Deltaproteobacteria bacterium]MBW2592371.1 PilN domain-containing protein [Deltaproteobacteria bacterium]
MIRINLLPFRAARKKENIRRQVSVFFLSLFLVVIILVWYNINLGKRISDLNSRIKDTQIQIAKYDKINQEIAQIKKALDTLKNKTEVIKMLEKSRKEPVHLLDVMTGMVVEKRMWFTSFESKGQTVNISGIALDNKTVADFMVRLENSKLFSSVNLKTLKQHAITKYTDLKSFQIICSKASLTHSKDENKTGKKAKK